MELKSEKQLQNFLKKECLSRGMLFYKFSSPAMRGVPDVIIVAPGGGVTFVELKSPSGRGRLSALQVRELDILREQGAMVAVISGRKDVYNLIKHIESKFNVRI